MLFRSVGSQQVPYIYEDYVTNETVGNSILKLYDMGPEERKKLGDKAREYVNSNFSLQKTIDAWHESLSKLIYDWKNNKKRWSITKL